MKKTVCLICSLAVCVVSACISPTLLRQGEPRDGYFVIWAHSDIQPRTVSDRKEYEDALDDVRENIGPVDVAIVAGDIIQGATNSDGAADFRWYMESHKKAPVKYWYEISGNHDGRYQKEYDSIVKKPAHYAVRFGSLLMIFLSDEDGRTSGTEISQDAFLWWKDLVEKNQDSIIITVTHTNLDHAGFKYGILSYRNIINSERFEEVIRKYRVDLWLSGHTHSPSKLDINEVFSTRFRAMFLNISSIRKDFFISQIESRFIIFKKGDNTVLVRTRYHDRKKFVWMREFELTLPNTFVWNGSEPEMIVFTRK